MEIKYKDFTLDNVFDACNVIDSIGFDKILSSIDKDTINALKNNKRSEEETRAIGIKIAMNVMGIVLGNIRSAKMEICKFISGCCEWENGSPLTPEELLGMKASAFVKLIKDIFRKEDIGDFFSEVSELLGMEHSDSKN